MEDSLFEKEPLIIRKAHLVNQDSAVELNKSSSEPAHAVPKAELLKSNVIKQHETTYFCQYKRCSEIQIRRLYFAQSSDARLVLILLGCSTAATFLLILSYFAVTNGIRGYIQSPPLTAFEISAYPTGISILFVVWALAFHVLSYFVSRNLTNGNASLSGEVGDIGEPDMHFLGAEIKREARMGVIVLPEASQNDKKKNSEISEIDEDSENTNSNSMYLTSGFCVAFQEDEDDEDFVCDYEVIEEVIPLEEAQSNVIEPLFHRIVWH